MPINKKHVTKILALDLDGIPDDKVDAAKAEVMDYIKEQMLADFAEAKSPVTGEAFKPLSAEYKKLKAQFSSSSKPNMELHGDMLDALEAKDLDGSKIEIGWFEEDQAVKAFNHTTGDTVPQRQLVPSSKDTFRDEIMEEIASILEEYRANKD